MPQSAWWPRILLPSSRCPSWAWQISLTGSYADGALAPNYLYDSTASNAVPVLNTSAQLPPVVELTVVAVDEKTYARVQGISTSALDLGLSTLFKTVGDTTNSANAGYAKDLNTLAQTLTSKKIDYRIFKLTVPIKAARWSREQKN
jgi:uncharacterized protein (TIGR02599 family)